MRDDLDVFDFRLEPGLALAVASSSEWGLRAGVGSGQAQFGDTAADRFAMAKILKFIS